MGTWLDFSIIFLVVLALIGMIEWLVRRFGPARRGQVHRLAVIDSARIDRRRTLVLIRRDNVEQLVMIGGPNDVVIEQNALRVIGAPERAQRVVPGPVVRVEFPNEPTSPKVRPQPMQSRFPSRRRPAPPLEPQPTPQGVHDVRELRETLKALLHDFDEQRLDAKPKPTSEAKLEPNFELAKSEPEIGPELTEPKSVEEKWTSFEPKPEQQAESQSESLPAKPEAESEPQLVEPELVEAKLAEPGFEPESKLEQPVESQCHPESEPVKTEVESEPPLVEPELIQVKLAEPGFEPQSKVEQQAESKAQPEK